MKNTPNLANEYHPIPKPNAKQKATPKPLNKIGKKTQASLDANKQMKKDFASMGIKSCEAKLKGCWKNNALTYAHLDKRRYLSKDDLTKACLLCIPCHQIIEAYPREKMRKFLQGIIDKRKV